MNRSLLSATIRIAAVWTLLLAAGCSLLRAPDPPPDRTQDARILQEVETRLEMEPEVDSTQIRVEVDAAIVIMYGSVAGLEALQCAHRNAQLVEGVRSVVDYLIIQRGPREIRCLAPRGPPGQVVTDTPD